MSKGYTPLTLKDVAKMAPKGEGWELTEVEGFCLTFEFPGPLYTSKFTFHISETSVLVDPPWTIDDLIAAADETRFFSYGI